MASLEEGVVATLFNQSDTIADEVLHHHPLLKILDDKGKIKRHSGGYEFRKPVMYQDSAVGSFFSGYETFDLDASQDLEAFQFDIKQIYEPVAISGRERRANRDEEMLLDLLEAKIEAATIRLKNVVSTSILGDGTGYGGREFDGIQKAIAASPTVGTYGGKTRSGNSWTQNQTVSVSGGFTAANIQENLTDAAMRITRGTEGPDVGLCGRTAWKLLHTSLTAIQRITSSGEKGKAGFKSLNYDGVDYYFDGGYGSSTLPVSTVRLMNSEYFSFDLVRGADFKPIEAKMNRPVDQDAFFTVIMVEGNLCCSAPALQLYAA